MAPETSARGIVKMRQTATSKSDPKRVRVLMPEYPGLDDVLLTMTMPLAEVTFASEVIPRLVQIWVHDYTRTVDAAEIVETSVDRFSYLFDIEEERLIAAWGIGRGRHTSKRDASRIASHPQSAGNLYHRGHAIAHTLGGGTDINLIAQLGSVNTGSFRMLERKAVDTPGALYFTYWKYCGAKEQTPASVQQGLLVPGRRAELRTHRN
jgi:DNA/RNA non-specific endonuclease